MSDKSKLDFATLLDNFIDGDLTAEERQLLFTRAAGDRELGRELASAMELQRALASLPADKAPASLQRRLDSIPRKQQRARPLDWLLRPQWALAVVLLLILAGGGGLYQQQQVQRQQQAELAQAKQDLALVLAYLEKINRSTNQQIQATVSDVTSEPVARITTQTLQTQLPTGQEFEL